MYHRHIEVPMTEWLQFPSELFHQALIGNVVTLQLQITSGWEEGSDGPIIPGVWWWIWARVSVKFLPLFSLSGQLGLIYRIEGIIIYQNLNRHTDKGQVTFYKPLSRCCLKIALRKRWLVCCWGVWAHFLVPAVLCEKLTVIHTQNGKGVLGFVLRV